MRRPLVICMLLVAALLPTPAQADSIVVVNSTNFPDSYGVGVIGCGSDPFSRPTLDANQFAIRVNQGPGSVPIGTRTWGFQGVGGDASGPLGYSTGPLVNVTAATAEFYTPSVETGVILALYQDPADTDGKLWIGKYSLTVNTTNTWTTVTGIGLSYDWTAYLAGPNGYAPTGDPVVSGNTVATFASNHGGSGLGGYILSLGCTGGLIHYDKFRFGETGNVTTYDFEAIKTTTTMGTVSGTISAGQAKTIKGQIDPPAIHAPLRLEAKKFGSTNWVLVATPYTGPDAEPVSVSVKPLVQTAYRWRFLPTEARLGSVSKAITISVRMVVTANPVASTVRLGKLITIKGKVRPAKPGHEVTLWKKTATGKVKLKTALIRADGTYTVSVKASKVGTWRLFVTVPAQSGNLAGTSAIRSVKVVR